MLAGEYSHNIDPKGRLTIPSKFRKELGMGFVITKGMDGCLYIYPEAEWDQVADRLSEMSRTTNKVARRFTRFMLAGACPGDIDKQGRVLLPKSLRDYAGLDKEVVLAGVLDRVEIWDRAKWEQNQSQDELDIETLASEMEEMGLSL